MGLYEGDMDDSMQLGYLQVHGYPSGGMYAEPVPYDRYAPRTEREFNAYQRARADFDRSRRIEPQSDMGGVYLEQAATEDLAGYISTGYVQDRSDLVEAARRGDVVRMRAVADRIKARRDGFDTGALARWTEVGDGDPRSVASRFAANAASLMQEGYMDEAVGRDSSGNLITVRNIFSGDSDEVREKVRNETADRLGLTAGAASVMTDRHDPLYDMARGLMQPYNSVRLAQEKSVTPRALDGDVASAELAAKMGAEFIDSKRDEFENDADSRRAATDFLTAWSRRKDGAALGMKGLARTWDLYRSARDGDGVSAVDWWKSFDECSKAATPQTEEKLPDDKGGYFTRRVASPYTDARRIPELALAVADELVAARRDVDFANIKAPLTKFVGMADRLARDLGVSSLDVIGRGDAAARATAYAVTGDAAFDKVGRGRTDGSFFDQAQETINRAQAVFGVEVDPKTGAPVTPRDPGGLGFAAGKLFQSVLRIKLAKDPEEARASAEKELADMLRIGLKNVRDVDPAATAKYFLDTAISNFDSDISGMSLYDMCRERLGGLEISQDRQTGEVTARDVVSEAAGAGRVDPATGEVRGATPKNTPGFLSLSPRAMSGDPSDRLKRVASMQALKDMPDKDLPYLGSLDSETQSAIVGALKATYEIKQHQLHEGSSWNTNEPRVMVPAVSKLLLANLERDGGPLGEDLRNLITSGDLIKYVEGHDRWFDKVGRGSDPLNDRVDAVRHGLARKVVSGNATPLEGMLWARLLVSALNRGNNGFLLAPAAATASSGLLAPHVKAVSAVIDALGRKHAPQLVGDADAISALPRDVQYKLMTGPARASSGIADWVSNKVNTEFGTRWDLNLLRGTGSSLDDDQAETAYSAIVGALNDKFGWNLTEKDNPLVRAGYVPTAIGKPTTGDYGGVVRVFDNAMRVGHPEGGVGSPESSPADEEAAIREGSARGTGPVYARTPDVATDQSDADAVARTIAAFMRGNVYGDGAVNYAVKIVGDGLRQEAGSAEAAAEYASSLAPMFEELVRTESPEAAFRKARKMAKARVMYAATTVKDENNDDSLVYYMTLADEDAYVRARDRWVADMAAAGTRLDGEAAAFQFADVQKRWAAAYWEQLHRKMKNQAAAELHAANKRYDIENSD